MSLCTVRAWWRRRSSTTQQHRSRSARVSVGPCGPTHEPLPPRLHMGTRFPQRLTLGKRTCTRDRIVSPKNVHRYVRCRAPAVRGRRAHGLRARSPLAPGPGRLAEAARRPDVDSSTPGPLSRFALQLAHVAELPGECTDVHVITHGNAISSSCHHRTRRSIWNCIVPPRRMHRCLRWKVWAERGRGARGP